MKFGEMFNQLKAGSEFIVKCAGVITDDVQAAAFLGSVERKGRNYRVSPD
jgi:hypothetical protein